VTGKSEDVRVGQPEDVWSFELGQCPAERGGAGVRWGMIRNDQGRGKVAKVRIYWDEQTGLWKSDE
jgi:hypothetical protein